MKKAIFPILCILILSLKSRPQELPPTNLRPIIKSQSVRIQARYVDGKGGKHSTNGCGFIINNKYVGTCYHIYKPDELRNSRLESIFVYYNPRLENGKPKYDSVSVDLKYKPTAKQYNFAHHVYDRNRFATDFIILKLAKPIITKPLTFTSSIKDDEPLYSLGITQTKEGAIYKFGISTFLYSINQKDSSFYFLASLGNETVGFSGTPVYNANGEIIGMSQFGWPNETDITLDRRLKEEKRIPVDLIGQIKEGYRKGFTLSFCINIEYLVQKYMIGYLND